MEEMHRARSQLLLLWSQGVPPIWDFRMSTNQEALQAFYCSLNVIGCMIELSL